VKDVDGATSALMRRAHHKVCDAIFVEIMDGCQRRPEARAVTLAVNDRRRFRLEEIDGASGVAPRATSGGRAGNRLEVSSRVRRTMLENDITN
jgi:hypothetical protein